MMQKKKEQSKDVTFIVKIKYRENKNWQGEITWVEAQKAKRFRSVLELINMMQSVIDEDEKKETF